MAIVSKFEEAPSSNFEGGRNHPSAHVISVGVKGHHARHRHDGFQDWASPSEGQGPQARRSLLKAIFAVSAVIFLAYLCSLSVGRRKTGYYSSRKLASSSSGDECDQSLSLNTGTAAGSISQGMLTKPIHLGSGTQAFHVQPGNADRTSLADTAIAASGKMTVAAAASQLKPQEGQTGLKRKGEEATTVERKAKKLRNEAPSEETALRSPPPLDADLDALIDSVLSGGVDVFLDELWIFQDTSLSSTADGFTGLRPSALRGTTEHGDGAAWAEDFWLSDGEPVSSIADSFTGPSTSAVGGDTEVPEYDEFAWSLAGVLGSSSSALPGELEQPKAERGSDLPLPVGTSGNQIQQRPPFGVETFDSGFSSDATQQSTMVSTQALTEGTFVAPRGGTATSSQAIASRTSPPSSTTVSASLLVYSGITLSQNREASEQSTSGTALPSDENVVLHFSWLAEVLPGLPDSVLRTHPFYHVPPKEGDCKRSFEAQFSDAFRAIMVNPHPALNKCREVMKKSSLTTQDLNDLLAQAERLCGYATGNMPISYRRGHASYAVEALGIVFLVLDTLHCAAEVLGDNITKHLWWPSVIRHIEGAMFLRKRDFITRGRCYKNVDAAVTLSAALNYYREGLRPPVRMVIGLKHALFCDAAKSSRFRGERWDAWRQDAAEWARSIESSLSGRK